MAALPHARTTGAPGGDAPDATSRHPNIRALLRLRRHLRRIGAVGTAAALAAAVRSRRAARAS